MDILSNLKYAKGSRKNKKRIARGEGSGHGGTSTRGMNGQMSRAGAKSKAWFEGGQMPLQRRIPKLGFTSPFKVQFQVVNLDLLEKLAESKKLAEINLKTLMQFGLISTFKKPVKILGDGELKSKLKIQANAFSKTAIEKIQAVGGSAETI